MEKSKTGFLLSEIPDAVALDGCRYEGLRTNIDKHKIPLSNGNHAATTGWRRIVFWDVLRISTIYKLMEFGVSVQDAAALVSEHFDCIEISGEVTPSSQLNALDSMRLVVFRHNSVWVAFDTSKDSVSPDDHGGAFVHIDVGLLCRGTASRLDV